MTSEAIRDPVTDHLLTAQNAALVVIDYQPSQIQTVASVDHELLVDNIVSVARLAVTSISRLCCRRSTSRTVRSQRSPSFG